MHPFVQHITYDTVGDPYDVARFWSTLLGRPLAVEDQPGDPAALVLPTDGCPGMLFVQVPEGKTVKNRVHLDLQPSGDRTRDQEVDRAIALGATQVADHRRADGSGFVVLADPEGNEFCVERSVGERA
ncbi:VOC family protein [Actinocatenispora rupis]|uniref:Glyoxalase n=1 Tax=Actinocatenispora rupis TaxID=519421 RepID=A0A8J3JA40_9ACTN|nr:VOC family protein [Actinocatenispora rupis]GID12864.1 glyoxalase [Actinocatenispora rupis]